MIYRTYTIEDLPESLWIDNIKNTFVYFTDGVVSNFEINDDYILRNNSSIGITQNTDAVVGQVIVLIEDSGAYISGVITTVDNEKLEIKFTNLLSFFDTNILNPNREREQGLAYDSFFGYDGINKTGDMLSEMFGGSHADKWRRLPIVVKQNNAPKVFAVWRYKDNTVNALDWIVDLFNDLNIVVSTMLVFETTRAFIELDIQQNKTSGELIKNNVANLEIIQTEQATPKASVCQVVNSKTKDIIDTWYLLNDNTVTSNQTAQNRVQPYMLTVGEFDNTKNDGTTTRNVAENLLLYKNFAHYIEVSMTRDSMANIENLNIGDGVTIVTKTLDVEQDTPILTNIEQEQYIVQSIYTGRKESSDNSMIKLVFGKFRVDYRDFIQQNYSSVRR